MLRAHRLALSLALGLVLTALIACGDDDGATTSSTSAATASTSMGGSSGSSGATGSGSSGDASSGGQTSGVPNNCDVNAIGEWNACKKGPLIDNTKCNWTESGQTAGSITCLSPSSGGGSVCAIEMCEDECDCFAPPATGDALVQCAPVLGNGGKACVLNCGGGQTCPDGMACTAGYCYWPN